MPRPPKSNRADGRYEIKRVIGHDATRKPVKKSFYGETEIHVSFTKNYQSELDALKK